MEQSFKTERLFSRKDLIYLIIPLVIEQLLAVLVGLADTVMVSSIGEEAVSAVSLVNSIDILIIALFAALSTGGAVVAGQYLGGKNYKEANRAGNQLILFTLLISSIGMVLMYLSRNFILHKVFGSIEPLVEKNARSYLLVVFASIPFLAIYNSSAALFRAMGNSKVTMISSLTMNLINILGNGILIYVFKMGVLGAAIPTLISRIVAAFLITNALKDQSNKIFLARPFNFKLDFDLVKDILKIGVPNGIENSMFQLGKILLLSVVSGFGTIHITANAVASSITGFMFLPGAAIGLAMLSVVSQAVGARDFEQARYYTRTLMKYTYIAMIVINGLVIGFHSQILSVYKLSDKTFNLARKIIIFYGLNATFFWPSAFTLANTLRAAKDVKYTMLVSLTSMWTVRIGVGIFVAKVLNMGAFGPWVGMIVDWYVRTFFFVRRYRSDKWERLPEL